LISIAASPSADSRASHGSARTGPPNSRSRAWARVGGTIDQPDLAGALVDQSHKHRAGTAACADHHDRAGIGAPARLRLANAFDVAEGVVVLAFERSVGSDDDAIHRADAVGERIDPVDHTERSLLVRNGQVAAREAERRERPQRRAQAVGLDGKRQVAADQARVAPANNCAASASGNASPGSPSGRPAGSGQDAS
jgi:hypothetical protein